MSETNHIVGEHGTSSYSTSQTIIYGVSGTSDTCPTKDVNNLHDATIMINNDAERAVDAGIFFNKKKHCTPLSVRMGIKSIRVYNDQVVKVLFNDGTSTKAVCAKGDTFSFEQGVSICLFKRILAQMSGCPLNICDAVGTNEYNRLMRDTLKTDEANKMELLRQEQEAQRKKLKLAKQKEKKEKKRQAAREISIEMQKEAYIRALREINGTDA